MISKILLATILLSFSFLPTSAHDFDEDTFKYILSNTDASWLDFSEFIQNGEDELLKAELLETSSKLPILLSLPGKKYVVNYTNENPDFSYSDIKELIQDDPMLSEIWAETIYSFLSTALRPDDSNFSVDFFLRTIYIGLEHILWGIDHILFLVTLIICLPKFRRILSIVTTFTVAHCITLILWGLWIISLPSIIVETMILISIIMMWIYALYSQVWETKNFYFETGLIFILWLFHGLWFAGFFSGILETSNNIIIPILWFNIWVELGQIFIISIISAFLYLIYKYFPKYNNTIKNAAIIPIIIITLYWLVSSFIYF